MVVRVSSNHEAELRYDDGCLMYIVAVKPRMALPSLTLCSFLVVHSSLFWDLVGLILKCSNKLLTTLS